MSGMIDKLFDEKSKKLKEEFDKRLLITEKMMKERFDTLEKMMTDMAAKGK